MISAQYKDGRGKWITIPITGVLNVTPERMAFEYCHQHGLSTRVLKEENGKEEVLKTFKRQHKTTT
jgi:hypothetical protein